MPLITWVNTLREIQTFSHCSFEKSVFEILKMIVRSPEVRIFLGGVGEGGRDKGVSLSFMCNIIDTDP